MMIIIEVRLYCSPSNLPLIVPVLVQRNLKKQLGPSIEYALNKPSSEMWDNVLVSFREALDKAESAYLRKAKSTNTTFFMHDLG